MKRFLTFALAAVSLVFLRADEEEWDVSLDGYVYVNVPTSCETGVKTGMFGNINISLQKVDVPNADYATKRTIKEALAYYTTDYLAFRTSQTANGISDPIAEANMAKWSMYMQIVLAQGMSDQIDYEKYRQGEEAKLAGEDAANAAAAVSSSASAKLSALQSKYKNTTTTASGLLAASALAATSGLSTEMSTLKESMKSIQQTLANKGTVSDEQIQAAIDAATKVAALEKKIAELDEIKKSMEKMQVNIDDFKVANNAVTNNFKNISCWLGSTNENNGAFIRPTNPRDGSKYADNKDINDYLSDIGIVAYSDATDMSMEYDPPSFKYRKRFYDTVHIVGGNSITNTMAVDGFDAVYNWADGTSVICTDGVYSIHQDYKFVTNIVWATNWTEAVKTITKNETTNIVHVVTNLVNNYETITTQVYKVESFTNWYEMVDWTTNFTVNVISNCHEILDWTTNFVAITHNITNRQEYVSFQTNMFYHENFITNFITVWNDYTNWHEVVDWTTNFVNITHNITNRQEYIEFHTNAYEKLHTIYNWNYVTNYIIRYMGGGKTDPTDPPIDPEDDPYSPEYDEEEHPEDENILHVKNARMISAITNAPFSKINAHNTLDFRSLDTNEYGLAQMYDFTSALDNDIPIVVQDGEDFYISWTQYPTNMLSITTNDIEKIKKWLKKIEQNNIFNVVVTNAEKFAEMKTNFWSQVDVDTLLDNASVWTNGEKKIEVKGFDSAGDKTYPEKHITDDGEILIWKPYARPDGDLFLGDVTYSSIETLADYEEGGYVSPIGDGTNVFTLAGFPSAETNTVPVKVKVDYPFGEVGYTLEWREFGAIGGDRTILGSDGSTATLAGTNRIVFASSNLVVHVENEENGDVKINVNNKAKKLTFQSGDNSNVKFTTIENDDEMIIKLDVYWK